MQSNELLQILSKQKQSRKHLRQTPPAATLCPSMPASAGSAGPASTQSAQIKPRVFVKVETATMQIYIILLEHLVRMVQSASSMEVMADCVRMHCTESIVEKNVLA